MKIQEYQEALNSLPSPLSKAGRDSWRAYLIENSGLPGPRGNLELAQAVAAEGDKALFVDYLAVYNPQAAPVNTPEEFLAFCGALGLGRLVAEGKHEYLEVLRQCANDPRWRTREAVAMALQNWADPPFSTVRNQNISVMLDEMERWSYGNYYEQRAAMAAVCEPRLLTDPIHAGPAFNLLNRTTTALLTARNRRDDGFQVLRKSLAYGWSVVVAAYPINGKPVMESWLTSDDKDVRWVMKQNLMKKRLIHLDAEWVNKCLTQLGKFALS